MKEKKEERKKKEEKRFSNSSVLTHLTSWFVRGNRLSDEAQLGGRDAPDEEDEEQGVVTWVRTAHLTAEGDAVIGRRVNNRRVVSMTTIMPKDSRLFANLRLAAAQAPFREFASRSRFASFHLNWLQLT